MCYWKSKSCKESSINFKFYFLFSQILNIRRQIYLILDSLQVFNIGIYCSILKVDAYYTRNFCSRNKFFCNVILVYFFSHFLNFLASWQQLKILSWWNKTSCLVFKDYEEVFTPITFIVRKLWFLAHPSPYPSCRFCDSSPRPERLVLRSWVQSFPAFASKTKCKKHIFLIVGTPNEAH